MEEIDKKLTKGNGEPHKLTKLYKKYKKFTNIMKKLGSFMKIWTKKVLMGIIPSLTLYKAKNSHSPSVYQERGCFRFCIDMYYF